jgi:hypothetical protein
MTGEAAVWANPYIKQLLRGTVIFQDPTNQTKASWAVFCNAFKLRWITVADNQAARQALVTLKQGSLLVEAFYLRFKAYTNQSNLSSTDLLKRFKAVLDPTLLVWMAEIHLDKKMFEAFTKAAIEMDNNWCNTKNIIQVSSGKELKYPSGPLANGRKHSHTKEKDSNAMDVDAVYIGIAASILTKEQNVQWQAKMKDRCYACGSKDHCAKDCRFQRDHAKCGHCEAEGHTQAVCLRRFARLPAGPAPKRNKAPTWHANVARIEEVSDSEEEDFNLRVSLAKKSGCRSSRRMQHNSGKR